MSLSADGAVGREASVITVMARTSDRRSARKRARSSGRKGRGLCTGHEIHTSAAEDDILTTRPALRVTEDFQGAVKMAPEMAPECLGRLGLFWDQNRKRSR